jgi:capsule polysaccharide export protein KpsE/RkpR
MDKARAKEEYVVEKEYILDLVEFGAKVADVCEEGVISFFELDRDSEEDIEFAKAIGYETARRVVADILDKKVDIDINATDPDTVKIIEDTIMKHLNEVVKEMDKR